MPRATSPPASLKDAPSLVYRPETSARPTGPIPPSSDPASLELDTLRSENASLVEEIKRLRTLESREYLYSAFPRPVLTLVELRQKETDLEEQRERGIQLQEQLRELELTKDSALQNEQRTISLLVDEKSSLMAELQRLENVDSRARGFLSLNSS